MGGLNGPAPPGRKLPLPCGERSDCEAIRERGGRIREVGTPSPGPQLRCAPTSPRWGEVSQSEPKLGAPRSHSSRRLRVRPQRLPDHATVGELVKAFVQTVEAEIAGVQLVDRE